VTRFDVYRHPDAVFRKSTPFLLDVQNDFIDSVGTRVVMPLRAAKLFGLPMRDLNPTFEFDGVQVVLDAASMAAFAAAELRSPVGNLKAQADLIVNALDTLFGTY
jgi:toxin CcdB